MGVVYRGVWEVLERVEGTVVRMLWECCGNSMALLWYFCADSVVMAPLYFVEDLFTGLYQWWSVWFWHTATLIGIWKVA